MTKYHKPGPGWIHLAGSVWMRGDIRVHLLGGAWNAVTGSEAWAHRWPESRIFDKFLRANNGNNRRAVLAWARDWEQRNSV